MAGRQAKVLSTAQMKAVLAHLSTTRNPARDAAMFLLSVRAGLRAKEIAEATWGMVTNSDGQVGDFLHLEDRAAKMGSGRTIPLSRELRDALVQLHAERRPHPDRHIIYSERGHRMSAASVTRWFFDLYHRLGFNGCSSHSGRRTFITNAARKITLVGGSLRDVMELAGHRSLVVTARYIEGDTEAKRKVVNII
ncbi:integrase [Azospirillum sp. TSH7]|uniref:tyrosine-type recombinase/integrase n=1 Tax=unclassified Azospirillum TaxID=2630922 RepID=UPI000D604850|nr:MULTISPECIES: site-specific integrase [unclassified Azospirillum]PWC52746.1 integrase [Azospirillum sp. TSH7]PWC56757.1 integrase [Azospirillum sp. TSH20]